MTKIKMLRRWKDIVDNEEIDLPKMVPSVTFKTRVRDESIGGPNPYRWQDVTSWDLFAGKRVLIFSVPGAFTPTCSTYQLPQFESDYEKFFLLGLDDIYCISVNDAFVMNAWAKQQNIVNVKMIPDGCAEFTRGMKMDVTKDNLGFGLRSWRYAAIVDNGKITKWFIEPSPQDESDVDPYGETSPDNILKWFATEFGVKST